MTRLLNTPIIGRLVASVDSSSIDMLAGLSKWSIFEDPALLLRRCRPHGQQQRARCREHAKISLHFVRLLFVTRAEKTRIAAVPALLGSRAGGNVREVITYRIKRNRGSVSTFDRVVAGPPCRKRLLVEPEVFEARAAHSRAFRQLMSLNVESADLAGCGKSRLIVVSLPFIAWGTSVSH